MKQMIYGMDTSFYNSLGVYSFEARCEMLKELGYNATYLTLWGQRSWQDVARLATVKACYGLEVAGVYTTLDIAGASDHAGNLAILNLLETIEGCTHIEISATTSDKTIVCSDPAHDALLEGWLQRFLPIAERRGLTLSLYHHTGYWLERIEDALRICRQFDHPQLRAVFCGFHWYDVDGTQLAERLQEALPFLHAVNICGSRHKAAPVPGELKSTIEPLDDGELDNFVLLGMLQDLGYQGMLGIQGYSIGGDAYTKLRRSLTTLHDMQRRLKEHPTWSQIQPL